LSKGGAGLAVAAVGNKVLFAGGKEEEWYDSEDGRYQSSVHSNVDVYIK
jgi:hypothetical protein